MYNPRQARIQTGVNGGRFASYGDPHTSKAATPPRQGQAQDLRSASAGPSQAADHRAEGARALTCAQDRQGQGPPAREAPLMTPPIDWFRDPQLDGPTPVTVTPEGRVYGHIATWDTPHVGMPGKNVRPPRSRADYGYFNTGVVAADDNGTSVDVSAGRLTLDTGHASLTSDASDAAAHYDNTGTVVANVTAGEDAHGIWFSGAVAPGVDDLKRHKLKSSSVSGDWRPIDGSLELVAALMVNSGGFPIPRARVASAAELAPLVAANVVPNPQEDTVFEDLAKPTYTLVDGTQADELTKYALVEITASGAVGEVDHVSDDVVAVMQLVNRADIKPASVDQALAASAARTERQKMQTIESRLEQLTAALEARDRADQAAALLADVDV